MDDGMFMQDQYKAIVDERARAISSARWRRSWFALQAGSATDGCCAEDAITCAATPPGETRRATGAI